MSRTLDGIQFNTPPAQEEVIALAHQHRKNLEEAIFHHDIRMGDFCLAQRKRVYDFTRELSPEEREAFYKIYDQELIRISDEDQLHPADSEGGVSVFAIAIVLVVIALILYFAFVRSTMG